MSKPKLNMKVGQKIFFESDNLPFTVMAVSDRFAVVSRKFNKKEDRELLEWEVERGASYSIESAYKNCKNFPVYSLIDFEKNIRSTDNLVFGIYDYFSKEDCEKCLAALENEEVSLSHRNEMELDLISILTPEDFKP